LSGEQIGRVLQAELEQTRQPLALYGSMYQSLTEKLGTLTAKRRVGFFRLLTLEFGIALNWAYPAYMAFLVLSIFGRGANEDPYECRVRYEHCQRGGRASAVESADVAGRDRAVCSASSPVQSLSEQVGTQVAQILQPSHREADPNPHSIPYGPERA